MIFNDTLLLDGEPRMTPDGYLVAMARVARTGIQDYMPQELGKTGDKPIRLYRPADEVFRRDTVTTFAHRPMTNGHPDVMVDASNWREHAIGYTGDVVSKDGDFIRVPLTLMDATAIQQYQAGKRELSAGYTADIDWTPGQTEAGEHYDAVMRNIRNNHIALVDAARAGHEARIGDTGTPPNAGSDNGGRMPDTRQVVVDGLTIETTEQGAQALDKLQKQIAAADQAHNEALAEKDKQLAAKDAQIDELKSQVMDAEALDAAIMERADLIATASKIADVDYKGKTLAEIRKTAVAAKLGDEAVKDKAEAYIEARFDILKEGLKDGDGAKKMADSGDAFKDAQAARDAWVARVYNGGKTKEA